MQRRSDSVRELCENTELVLNVIVLTNRRPCRYQFCQLQESLERVGLQCYGTNVPIPIRSPDLAWKVTS